MAAIERHVKPGTGSVDISSSLRVQCRHPHERAANDQVSEDRRNLTVGFEVGLYVLLHGERRISVAGALRECFPVDLGVAGRPPLSPSHRRRHPPGEFATGIGSACTAPAAAYEFFSGPLLREPFRVGERLLPPMDDRFSARRGTNRIVYRIDEKNRVVTMVDVDLRRDVYRF